MFRQLRPALGATLTCALLATAVAEPVVAKAPVTQTAAKAKAKAKAKVKTKKPARKRAKARVAVNPVAAAVGEKVAVAGAGFLLEEAKKGTFGKEGATVANFIAPLLEDAGAKRDRVTQAKLDEIKAQIEGLSVGIASISNAVGKVHSAVLQADYNNATREIIPILGAIRTANNELHDIASATSYASAKAHFDRLARLLDEYPLSTAEETMHLHIAGTPAGGDGITKAAYRTAVHKSHPFFGKELSNFPHTVWRYYETWQQTLLNLRINVARAKGLDEGYVEKLIFREQNRLSEQRGQLRFRIYSNAVIDVRTNYQWWFHDSRAQHPFGSFSPTASQERGKYVWAGQFSSLTAPDVPTVAQFQQMTEGWKGHYASPASYIASRTGFSKDAFTSRSQWYLALPLVNGGKDVTGFSMNSGSTTPINRLHLHHYAGVITNLDPSVYYWQ